MTHVHWSGRLSTILFGPNYILVGGQFGVYENVHLFFTTLNRETNQKAILAYNIDKKIS